MRFFKQFLGTGLCLSLLACSPDPATQLKACFSEASQRQLGIDAAKIYCGAKFSRQIEAELRWRASYDGLGDDTTFIADVFNLSENKVLTGFSAILTQSETGLPQNEHFSHLWLEPGGHVRVTIRDLKYKPPTLETRKSFKFEIGDQRGIELGF
jgi:hypothetical protein